MKNKVHNPLAKFVEEINNLTLVFDKDNSTNKLNSVKKAAILLYIKQNQHKDKSGHILEMKNELIDLVFDLKKKYA